MITQDRLKELLHYDPTTGVFTNLGGRGPVRKGSRAGHLDMHGYRRIVLDYVKYYEHHLAWIYVHGVYPGEIDHRDGVRSNNAIRNLRPANRSENCFNSKRETGESGLAGAYLDKRSRKWYSKIQLGYQVIWLGSFGSKEEAHAAFVAAVTKYHGEYAYANRPLDRRE